MIPAGTGELPDDSQAMAQAIGTAIQSLIGAPAGAVRVDCTMETPPEITRLAIHLSQAELAAAPLQPPKDLTTLREAHISEFTIDGDPVLLRGAPATLHAHIHHCPVQWKRDTNNHLWLTLATGATPASHTAPHGELRLEMTHSALQQAVRAVAHDAASRAGAKLKDLQLRLSQTGERSLRVEADVAASKFMMTAQLTALAEASLDEAMNLTITHLDLAGKNSAGQMIVGTLGNQLIHHWKGRTIALADYVVSGARLTGTTLRVEPTIYATAQFGAAPSV